jgi:NADH:ubiquinone oxidoreductase subunit C
MENQQLQEFITKASLKAQVAMGKQYLEISVDAKDLMGIATLLKESKEMLFDYLFCQSAVDYVSHLTIVYHLESTTFRHRVVLKAKIADTIKPEINSVYDLWMGAEYHEREIFDLFGVNFINHPDLRKMFLDADWVGYPLRKDYKDEINMVER